MDIGQEWGTQSVQLWLEECGEYRKTFSSKCASWAKRMGVLSPLKSQKLKFGAVSGRYHDKNRIADARTSSLTINLRKFYRAFAGTRTWVYLLATEVQYSYVFALVETILSLKMNSLKLDLQHPKCRFLKACAGGIH